MSPVSGPSSPGAASCYLGAARSFSELLGAAQVTCKTGYVTIACRTGSNQRSVVYLVTGH